MSDVNISKYRAQVIRQGSTPASPGFAVAEGQNPVDPSGSGQTHLPVTIATASTGLSITESQILSGAGLVSQYIRGDGSLADFPATTGGGSSVSYYLNGSVSQGTIVGVAYKELNRTPVFGAGTDITINADGYIASFITDALDPNKLLIPAGNWNLETYFSASSNGGSPSFYVELYKYNGTTFTLIATSSSAPELIAFGTNLNPYFSTLAVPETVLALTDRLALRYYVTHSGRTITLHTENDHLCEVITTFTTGLTALNGLTNQVQFFAVGTSGTDFAISSVSDTHTFNLPTASAVNRGALSSADWTTFNGKTSNLGTVTSVGLSSATSGVTIGSSPVTTSGTITLAIATASGSLNGLLSSTDWTTFNGKQNLLTNPVTGTGTSGQVAYFNGTSAITGESGLVWDAANNNLSIGGATANSNLTVSGSDNSDIFTVLAGLNSRLHVGTVSSGTNVYVRSQNNYTLNLGVNNTNYLSIFNSGNVFIGSSATDAGFKLDVNGTGRFTSSVTSSQFISASNLSNSQLNTGSIEIQSYVVNNSWVGDNVFYNGSNFIRRNTGYASQIYFETSGAIAFFTSISAAGGTTPTFVRSLTLTNAGAATFSSSVTGNIITSTSAGSTQLFLKSTGGGSNRDWQFQTNETAAGDISLMQSTTAGGATYATKLNITATGNVLIGTTTNPGFKLYVSGSGNVVGITSSDNTLSLGLGTTGTMSGYLGASGSALYAYSTNGGYALLNSSSVWVPASDAKRKRNFEDYNLGLDAILGLKPKYYHMDFQKDIEEKQVGLVAQEVKDFIPLAYEDNGGFIGLNYNAIIVTMVKAIQELKKEINTLKN